MQFMAYTLGGKVDRAETREYGEMKVKQKLIKQKMV